MGARWAAASSLCRRSTDTHPGMGTQMKKKFVVSKSVYEFALKYQGLRGEISGAFPHQTFTIEATSDEFEDLFALLRFVELGVSD
jgi:hypothetical protein